MWRKAASSAALALAMAGLASAEGPAPPALKRRGCILLADLENGRRILRCTGDVLRRAYLPGSVFKVASAMALLRHGRPGPSLCTGLYADRGRRVNCVLHSGHGVIELEGALAQSCNFYFREHLPDREALLEEAMELGLARTEALPELRRAPLPDLVLGLAQPAAITPEEMLQAAVRWSAREDAGWRIVRRALAECVRSGTCQGARATGLAAAGKTGSAPAPDGSGKTQAWFVGFAPVRRPRVAVVVFLEKGRGREAAEVAGEALRWYFALSRS